MLLGVVCETYPGERRVAITPGVLAALAKVGLQVRIEAGAGLAAGFVDEEYVAKGAEVVSSRGEVFGCDVIAQVRALGANLVAGAVDLPLFRSGQTLVGLCDPLGNPAACGQLAERGVHVFSLELVPRITRAQAMDVLSSMATVAGYRAVLLAATHLTKMFPMMMTAAGTLTAAKVLVIGAGVAGLNAIATARRLGGVVQAYDVRAAVKEQIESVGAKFVELPLETAGAEGKGGYAKALDEDTLSRQRELLGNVVAASDVVISTAAVPGKPSPLLITRDAVERMPAGSVVVDLAAERGGNCELTKADEIVVHRGVTILGPTNLPSDCPRDASSMFAKNVATFLGHIVKDGKVRLDGDDEIIRATLWGAGDRG